MQKFALCLVAFLCLCLSSNASNYYWVGGTGSWNDLTKWASSSGGAGSAYVQVPTSNDNVFFDANSFNGNSQIITISVAAVCRNFNCSNATTTYKNANAPKFTISSTVDLYGDLLMPSVDTLKPTTLTTALLRFVADTFRNVYTYNNRFVGGTFVCQSNTGNLLFQTDLLAPTSDMTFNSGTLNFNGRTLRLNTFASITATARTLNLTNSIAYFNANSSNGWNVASGITLISTNSQIVFDPQAPVLQGTTNFNTGGYTYNVIRNTCGGNITVSNACTIDSLILEGNAYINNNISITGTMTLFPAREYIFQYSTTYTFSPAATFVANGTCSNPVTIRGWFPTPAAIFTRSSGWTGSSISYCNLSGLNFAGGGNLTANNSSSLGDLTNITVNGSGQKYFWIGNGGNWRNAAHWSNTSGGSSCGCIPMGNDSVYFDAHSFSLSGQTVSIDSTIAVMKSMDWTGALNSPIFYCNNSTSTAGNKIILNSGLTFITGMTNSVNAPFYFCSTNNDSITSAGRGFQNNINLVGTGSYTLRDSLSLINGTTGKTLYVLRGTFNTNSYGIRAGVLQSNTSLTRAINLGGSYISLNPGSAGGATVLDFSNGPLTFTCGSSTITATNSANGGIGFSGNSKIFNDVVFLACGGGITLNNDNTFRTLTTGGLCAITGSNTFKDSLIFIRGGTNTFTTGKTQTFSTSACDAQIKMRSSGCSANPPFTTFTCALAGQSTFTKTGGTPIAVDYIFAENMKKTGTQSISFNTSSDVSNNTGFTFTSPTGRNLYWVGSAGNWTDATHWALSSGGSGGNCGPTLADNVNFDANSFTSGSKTVTVDITEPQCKKMDWTGALYTPSLVVPASTNVNIYGSLYLITAMTLNLQTSSLFLFQGYDSTTYSITSNKQPFYHVTIDCRGGAYNLNDSLPLITSYVLTVNSGTFNTRNYNMGVGQISSNTTKTRAINLGSSLVRINQGIGNIINFGGSGLTFNAGTSSIKTTGSTGNITLAGGNFAFADVEFNHNVAHVITISGDNTFRRVRFSNMLSASITGNNTILDSISFMPGKIHQFTSGTTTYFKDTTKVLLVGTGSNPIYLRSSTTGSAFNFSKPAGSVCADFIYIKDNVAGGGAIYTGGGNANDQGGNTGWDFSLYPTPGNGYITGGIKCKNSPFMNKITITTGTYPMIAVIKNLRTNAYDTVRNITYSPFYYAVNPADTSVYRLEKIIIDRCFGGETPLSALDTVYAPRGIAGKWKGRINRDWNTCANWDDYGIPDDTTDVWIPAGIDSMPKISISGSLSRNLKIDSGASLRISRDAGSISVYGNWLNNGTFYGDSGTVSLRGRSAQTITNGTFRNLVINTFYAGQGVTLGSNITVKKSLTLTKGKIVAGIYALILQDSSAASLSGGDDSCYITGVLRRYIGTNSGIYTFPLGIGSNYTRADLMNHNLSGTAYISASMIEKPGIDKGMKINEGTMRYDSVHTRGVWKLTPDAQPVSGTYDLKLYLNAFAGLSDNKFAIFTRNDTSITGSAWAIGGATMNGDGGAGRLVSDGYALRFGYSAFSQKGIGEGHPAGTLPVKLLYLKAKEVNEQYIALDWECATEIDNRGFYLERSEDGLRFEDLKFIEGAENSNISTDYHYDDYTAKQGIAYYYRLNQVDRNGSSLLSDIVSASLKTGEAQWAHFVPNPVDASTRLIINSHGQTAELTLTNEWGAVVQKEMLNLQKGLNQVPVGLSLLPAGTYIATVICGTEKFQDKVVITF